MAIVAIASTVILVLGSLAALSHSAGAAPHWRVRLTVFANRSIDLPAAMLLRAATSPLGMRFLDSRQFATRIGVVSITRDKETLGIHCARCSVLIPELASRPLRIVDTTLTLRRQGNDLRGALHAPRLRVDYAGSLDDEGVVLRWSLPRTELADALEIFRTVMPELAHARLQGRLSAQGTLTLPQRRWRIDPSFEGLEVTGLGTENLRFGPFSHSCRDAYGNPQRRLSGEGSREWLALDDASRWLARAVIAAEDGDFRHHPGYDLTELQRAQRDNDTRGRVRGASTLTQQLAKNLFTGAEPTLARKLRELLYVVEMERTLGKWRILSLYLNTADWGPGICGAREAARHYFKQSPARLDPRQSAWLAGMLRNPQKAFNDEFSTGHADEKRLKWVIDNMRLQPSVRHQASRSLDFAVVTPGQ